MGCGCAAAAAVPAPFPHLSHTCSTPLHTLMNMCCPCPCPSPVVLPYMYLCTEEYVPRADLVLFVLSADRPLSESELAFLKYIRQWRKKVVFVVNKVGIGGVVGCCLGRVGVLRHVCVLSRGADSLWVRCWRWLPGPVALKANHLSVQQHAKYRIWWHCFPSSFSPELQCSTSCLFCFGSAAAAGCCYVRLTCLTPRRRLMQCWTLWHQTQATCCRWARDTGTGTGAGTV